MSKVSIVIPVYNAEKHLKACIKSVIKQSFSDWELILVDDGSKDKSGKICDDFAAADNRIRVIHQENQGSISARRNGVMACRGKYMCFSDADDTMPKNALQVMHNAIPKDELNSVVIGNCDRLWNIFKIKSRYQPPCFSNSPCEYDRKSFINELYCSWFGISNVPVCLYAKLYPSNLLKSVFASVPNVVHFMGDDLIMTFDLLPQAERIVIIPDVIYHYRVGGGTSRFQPNMMDDWIALYNFKRQYAEKYPMPQDIGYLTDVELCNMVFTFFEMSNDFGKLTDELISETCRRPEVIKAASNPKMKDSFVKAGLLKRSDLNGIRSYTESNKSGTAKKILKKIYTRFA